MRYIERGEHPRKKGLRLGRLFEIHPREQGEQIEPEPKLRKKKKKKKKKKETNMVRVVQEFGHSNMLLGLVGADWGSRKCEQC